MANAKIDDNREHTSLAVDTNGVIKNLLVDPTTDRLLIVVDSIGSRASTLNVQKIDDNDESVSLAYDGTNIKPLLTTDANLLLVDLIF